MKGLCTVQKIKNFFTAAPYSQREEVMSSLVHWLGTIIVCLGAGCLITLASLSAEPYRIAAVSIYSFAMIILYCASTLYHVSRGEKAKNRLKVFDHSSIYLLIAGTYTPFLLVNLRGPVGWAMFGVIWAMSVLGITAKIFFMGRVKKLSVAVYIIMGWLVVFAIKPLINTVSTAGLIFLLVGGLFYSGGVYFYVRKDKEFYHGVWHIFVLFGTVSHFFAVLCGCVLPLKTCY
ncbi:MAG: hemolysin III family protein [Elusimicrobiota bacterium]|jgi:hemolysin III|nr:hemolysin III family protein [Elusimicrobiota bacterium]